MRKFIAVALAASVLVLPVAAPASANTGAIFRTIVLFGAAAAAAIGITNANHKRHRNAEEENETDRRQASYKAYYYRTTGEYPTPE